MELASGKAFRAQRAAGRSSGGAPFGYFSGKRKVTMASLWLGIGYWFLLLFLVLILKKNLEHAGKLTNHLSDLIAAYRCALIRLYGPTRLLQDRFDSIEVDCTLISDLLVWAYPPGPL